MKYIYIVYTKSHSQNLICTLPSQADLWAWEGEKGPGIDCLRMREIYRLFSGYFLVKFYEYPNYSRVASVAAPRRPLAS